MIALETNTLRNSINKAYLKETVARNSFDDFKTALSQLLDSINSAQKKGEHEEHFKNLLVPFLTSVGFEDRYINTSARIDLAIHTGNDVTAPVGVLLELKRPSNNREMITRDAINRKALHEAVLYYLEQRLNHENSDLKQIIITDTLNWFVFDAQEFERCFYRPATLKKTYRSWQSNQKVSSNKEFMYQEIARFIGQRDDQLQGVHLDITKYGQWLKARTDSQYEKKLIPLYKFCSPIHLLKEPFANDSNTLNRDFYRELLYILGLEEVKDGNTRYIERAREEQRQPGSLIENTIRILESEDHLSRIGHKKSRYGKNRSEQIFTIALELSITWMNRILFLKLLEAQLFRYHRQDRNFKFLNTKTIDGYDELNKLFFQVLARRIADRPDDVIAKFGHIPYLNSSLFDLSTLEHQTLRISNLDDSKTLPVHSRSVLTGQRGSEQSTLQYLFEFLEAYDFAAEGGEEIQKERKTLINASVLGLIFEKINGYRDGSFFTPGFITEYMARETLRKAVREKFGEVLTTLTPVPSPAGGRGVLRKERGEGTATGSKIDKDVESTDNYVHDTDWPLPESLINTARELRKNQTEAEELLWQLLRNKKLNGYKFRRQHPIKPGFVLDFYCAKEKLAIEIDGGYHNSSDQKAVDKERTQLLNEMDIRVIRFTNEEVLENTVAVLQEIAKKLGSGTRKRPLSGSLPPGESTQPSHPSPLDRGTEAKDEKLPGFTEIYNAIGREISIERANEIIDAVTICDPAVGSGHFLVSCLNELLAIKSDLGILCDEEGRVLRSVKIIVENDELIVTWGNEELFEYDASPEWHGTTFAKRKIDPERQRIQKTLFHEKRHIIENCLFGVDINPNSVKICRLRLWIELLKNTYYTTRSNHMELEVLPNIDINIKTGNSLVSRFGLDDDLSAVFRDNEHSLADYKQAVEHYKNTGDRTEKRRLQQLISEIKKSYTATLLNNRPINEKLSKQEGRLNLMQNADLFGEKKFTKTEIKKQQRKVEKLKKQKAEEESGAFYNHAFEWRFEFPEVLDDEGRFTGFDVVIGNPPYIRQEQLKELKPYFKEHFEVYQGTADLYQYFIEQGVKLLNKNGLFHYIVSNKWMRANYGKPLRKWMQQYQIESIIDFGDLPVFEEATTYPCLLQIRKDERKREFEAVEIEHLDFDSLRSVIEEFSFQVDQTKLNASGWSLISKDAQQLLEKIKSKGVPLKEYVDGKIYRGILTGLNKAFVIDEEKRNELIEDDLNSAQFIKPFLAGRDIKRYQPPTTDKHLINIPNGWTNKNLKGDDDKWELLQEKFPALSNYLSQYEEKAKSRYDQGEYWWELRACSYLEEFEKPKIILPDISLQGNFTFDEAGKYHLVNTAYLIGKNDKYLLGILASKLVDFFYRNISSSYRGGYLRFIRQYLQEIPIAKPHKKQKLKIETRSDQILTAKAENPEADTSELESEIDQLVYELYGLSEEEIEIVEGSVG